MNIKVPKTLAFIITAISTAGAIVGALGSNWGMTGFVLAVICSVAAHRARLDMYVSLLERYNLLMSKYEEAVIYCEELEQLRLEPNGGARPDGT